MTLNQIFDHFPKIFKNFKQVESRFKALNWKYFVYLFLIILLFLIFIIISNLIEQKNKIESQNLDSLVKSQEFSNLSDYFISKINSPYKEVEYLIQNNDSIEKILKKLGINANDIKTISGNLKKKKTN